MYNEIKKVTLFLTLLGQNTLTDLFVIKNLKITKFKH